MNITKKMIILISHAMFLNVLLINGAYAYFDYGTGSMLIQSLIAFFGMFAMFMYRLKDYFLSFFRKKSPKEETVLDEDSKES